MDLVELRINRTAVTQNSKCESCVHYDGNAAAKGGVCEVGSMPSVCGDGGDVKFGFAPLARLGCDEIDDLATPGVNGMVGTMNEHGAMEKTIVMKRVCLGDEDLTIAQRIYGKIQDVSKSDMSWTMHQGEVNRHADVELGERRRLVGKPILYQVAKSLRDLHMAPRKQRKYDLEAVLDFLKSNRMPVTDDDYEAAGISKAVLDAKARKHIKPKNFALPKEKAYPIEDREHAANAESRAAQFASPSQEKKIDAAVHRKYPDMGKSVPNVKKLPFDLQKAEGEGSRGGHVIGHTKSGKAVYRPSEARVAAMREHVNLQKKTAEGKLAEHAHAHVTRHKGTVDSNYTPEEHADAAQHHAKEGNNYSNSDKVRALHHAISAAHKELSEGKTTPHAQREEKLKKQADAKERRRIEKERNRKTDTVATTARGHAIQNTHHIRFGGFGPEIKEGPASESRANNFAKEEWAPVETELGAHLKPEQNRDIADYHRERAAHHTAESHKHALEARKERATGNYDSNVNHFTQSTVHRNAAENHKHAAQEHEAHARGVHGIEAAAGDAEEERTPSSLANAKILREHAKRIRDDVAAGKPPEDVASRPIEKSLHPRVRRIG